MIEGAGKKVASVIIITYSVIKRILKEQCSVLLLSLDLSGNPTESPFLNASSILSYIHQNCRIHHHHHHRHPFR